MRKSTMAEREEMRHDAVNILKGLAWIVMLGIIFLPLYCPCH